MRSNVFYDRKKVLDRHKFVKKKLCKIIRRVPGLDNYTPINHLKKNDITHFFDYLTLLYTLFNDMIIYKYA